MASCYSQGHQMSWFSWTLHTSFGLQAVSTLVTRLSSLCGPEKGLSSFKAISGTTSSSIILVEIYVGKKLLQIYVLFKGNFICRNDQVYLISFYLPFRVVRLKTNSGLDSLKEKKIYLSTIQSVLFLCGEVVRWTYKSRCKGGKEKGWPGWEYFIFK